LSSLKKKLKHSDAHDQTHFITFVIAICIVLLFTAPFIAWKFTGQSRATALVKQWEAEDARERPQATFSPTWTVKLYNNCSSGMVRNAG
jgi:hypothetical protein